MYSNKTLQRSNAQEHSNAQQRSNAQQYDNTYSSIVAMLSNTCNAQHHLQCSAIFTAVIAKLIAVKKIYLWTIVASFSNDPVLETINPSYSGRNSIGIVVSVFHARAKMRIRISQRCQRRIQ